MSSSGAICDLTGHISDSKFKRTVRHSKVCKFKGQSSFIKWTPANEFRDVGFHDLCTHFGCWYCRRDFCISPLSTKIYKIKRMSNEVRKLLKEKQTKKER